MTLPLSKYLGQILGSYLDFKNLVIKSAVCLAPSKKPVPMHCLSLVRNKYQPPPMSSEKPRINPWQRVTLPSFLMIIQWRVYEKSRITLYFEIQYFPRGFIIVQPNPNFNPNLNLNLIGVSPIFVILYSTLLSTLLYSSTQVSSLFSQS